MICDSDLSLFGRMANSRVHKDEKVQRAELSLLWCLRLKYLPTEYSKSNLRFMLQVLGMTRLNDNFKRILCRGNSLNFHGILQACINPKKLFSSKLISKS